MNELHRFLITYLLNSLWQVPMLALVALACARLLGRTSLVLQHRIWVATLLVSILLPVASTSGWLVSGLHSLIGSASTHSSTGTVSALQLPLEEDPSLQRSGAAHSFFIPSPANAILFVWLCFSFYRGLCLLWAWRSMAVIAREAEPLELTPLHSALWATAQLRFRMPETHILVTDRIAAPATVGTMYPVILLPRKVLTTASAEDFAAMLAHESAHIQRKDFLLNLLYEAALLPVSYHPISRLLRSRITDSRELVCDGMAAAHSGNPVAYARSLVRLAESLVPSTRIPLPAMGIFEGNNLEGRIMSLLNSKPRLGRLATVTVVACFSLIFGSCCVAASAFNFQPAAIVADELKPYAGTWQWMFQGRPFVTLILSPAGDHFTGTMTNGTFTADDDGNMTAADGKPGTSMVVRSFFAGKVLHVLVEDGDNKSISEFTMTLTSPGSAEFNSGESGAPKNLKSWPAERVSEQAAPPVNKGEVFQIGGEVTAPKVTYTVDPKYPPDQNIGKGSTGFCVVRLLVDAAGAPQDVHITRSLGPSFDRNAIEAVKQYRFQPATLRGKPVPVQLSVQIEFKRF